MLMYYSGRDGERSNCGAKAACIATDKCWFHVQCQTTPLKNCATCNLDIKRLICCTPGDNNTRFVGIVENNAICDVPRGTIEIRCATHTSFFLHSENDHQRWMW